MTRAGLVGRLGKEGPPHLLDFLPRLVPPPDIRSRGHLRVPSHFSRNFFHAGSSQLDKNHWYADCSASQLVSSRNGNSLQNIHSSTRVVPEPSGLSKKEVSVPRHARPFVMNRDIGNVGKSKGFTPFSLGSVVLQNEPPQQIVSPGDRPRGCFRE